MLQILENCFSSFRITDWVSAGVLALASYFFLKYAKFFLLRKTENNAIWFHALAKQTYPFLFFVIALYLGIKSLGCLSPFNTIFSYIFTGTLLFQVAAWGNVLIRMVIEKQSERADSAGSAKLATFRIAGFFAKAILYFLLLALALENLGINVTSLVAGLGIGGIAIALAIQSVLGDLFASLTILLDHPFVVGDIIVVDTYTGTVENIGIKTTRLRSVCGEQVIFSNTDLLKSRIRNFGHTERRIVFGITIDRLNSLAKIRRVPDHIRQVIETVPMARFERAHLKRILDFGLEFELAFKVLSPDYTIYMDTREKVNYGLLETLAREDISIAYPTQKVFYTQAAQDLSS